jgi:agmatinase
MSAPGSSCTTVIDETTTDGTLLVVNPKLAILRSDATKTVVWHTMHAWQVDLGPGTARLWQAFAVPRTVASVVNSVSGDAGDMRQRVRDAVAQLREKELLVQHDPDGIVLPSGRGGMFNTPVLPLSDALRGATTDVVFIGMPYDVGVTHRPGSRFAPNYLRRTSGALFQYRDAPDGPAGVYDPVSGRWLLRGTRLADTGDVSHVVHTRNGPSFDALAEVVRACAMAERLPVVLGGDHSITLPVIQGLAGRYEALGVLHIDAHADYGEPRTDGWRDDCHHGNVMNWVVGHEGVHRIAQYGIRQLENPRSCPHPKRMVWPGTSVCAASPEQVLAQLPDELAYHVTIDVDGLDPTALSATGTPLPGGFTSRELVALLEMLCWNRRIVGIDMVEVLPGLSDVDGLVASDVLLRTIAAAVEGRHG